MLSGPLRLANWSCLDICQNVNNTRKHNLQKSIKLTFTINTTCKKYKAYLYYQQHCDGLGGLVVSALDFQAGYRGFESRSGRDNFQTIITPSSYSTCPGLSIQWTGRRLVTNSGTKCAWVIHESKAVQIHIHHSNRRCLYVPRVPGSVKEIRTTTLWP